MGIVVLASGSGREEGLLEAEANLRGHTTLRVGRSALRRHMDELRASALAYGGVNWTLEAFRQAGIKAPAHDPYPEKAHFALGRRVWKENSLLAALALPRPLFIKPADSWKRFTGFVIDFYADVRDIRFQGYSRSRPVWCSEPVHIAAEYRVYVLNDQVSSIQPAPGNPSTAPGPDAEVINGIASVLAGKRQGYVFDVGVLAESGETILVEVNDGFSMGAYGDVPIGTYFDLLAASWRQLLLSN